MNDEQLQQLSRRIGEQLKKRQATVTAAESCTGGWIAKVFTDISGSSAWFERGFVTYSNEAKQQMVGVQDTTLQQHGAVSEQTVREMATGAAKAAAAEYAIAVSGIAGPDGGTPDKPVGTVWFAIAGPEGRVLAQRQIFAGDRDAVRRQSVVWALQTLLDEFLIN
ncbi:nicotinamide-nucleotide amidase [Pantoea sp. S18]|uniref:nicotinamide-nucleotide amidase n=1 Tax=Pantoea TaxID=53335 RepID=UPI0012AE8FFF|nr:nicotinamide-nucleotide amidase [Pantoea sp. S18]MEA5104653.1 nicotinamide-nucleotide amidase [Pantoea sp. S18]MRT41718.1 nicotinamide-nucleotide amidase [Enterobacteriaceae bacterium RIT702]